MVKCFVIVVLAILLACPCRAQDIRYEKYTLDNGLTVILHEDHRMPTATVNIWYRVGSKDEPAGRSGFAHLFEHLMFMGTHRIPGNEFDVIMETAGGSNNASTSLDRTNYFSQGPASLLPTLLWLDADRLEDVARAMDQAKLDRQRDVVRNEIRENVENTPYARASEYVHPLMYPPGHPYHHPIYGSHEDLEAATVFDVRDFFATYYVPNNASLVVAGSFDPQQIKPLIEQLFGTLPRGGGSPHRSAPPVALEGERRATMVDKVQLPLVRLVWHSPAYFRDGDAEMDIAGAILGSGTNSRLYQRLVLKEQLAVEVASYQASAFLGSLFHIDVYALPDSDLSRIETIIDEEVARLREQGPTEQEVQERTASFELAKLSELQSLHIIADRLNEYEFAFGEPNSFRRDLDRYRDATARSVQRWAGEVLHPEHRGVIRVVPEQPERSASARDARPQDLPIREFDPPQPERFELSSGVPVLLWQRSDLPLLAVHAVFAPGAPLASPRQSGLPALAGAMLDEGAGELGAVEFASTLQRLGASMTVAVGQESASVALSVLARNFPEAAGLMSDAIIRPRFEATDWDRVKSLHLEMLRQQDEEPAVVAARVGLRGLFGPAHPYGLPTDGTVETVSAFTLDQAREEHARLFRPEHLTLLIAGDITQSRAKEVLEQHFGRWERENDTPSTSAAPPPEHEGLRVLLVDRPGAVQTVIRFVAPAPTFATDDRVELRLLNTLFGGGFTSRLNQNLREKHGFTYGAGSRFVLGRSAGYFIATSSVRTDVTGDALREFIAEFERLRSGDVTTEEAQKARETLRTDTLQSLESLQGLLATAAEFIAHGAPFSQLGEDLTEMRTETAEHLNALAGKAAPLGRGVLVLVGDAGAIREQIKPLNLPPPTSVDARGEAIDE